ncbi:MAG: hypothetical protein ACOCYE_11255, partial [Pseudomonadota bacterium]
QPVVAPRNGPPSFDYGPLACRQRAPHRPDRRGLRWLPAIRLLATPALIPEARWAPLPPPVAAAAIGAVARTLDEATLLVLILESPASIDRVDEIAVCRRHDEYPGMCGVQTPPLCIALSRWACG